MVQFISLAGIPSTFHQYIVGNLLEYVSFIPRDLKLGYGILGPVAVVMPSCDPVQPDAIFVREERVAIIHDGLIWDVPDLIIEVLSPTSVAYDEGVKLEAYVNAGVPEYVVIAPRERKLRLYSLEHPGKYADAREFMGDDLVKFACLPPIEFRLSALFENALDTTV